MELRKVRGGEENAFADAAMRSFHHELTDAERAQYRRVDELERMLVWDDDGEIVATASAYSRAISVPGGEVPCAAVTAVTVLGTHRRRGLLTGMMRRQLDELHDGGEPIAALQASEGGIYGRYGYGPAAYGARLVARRADARLLEHPEPGDPLRMVPPASAIDAMRPIHADVRATRPGMLDRLGPWWEDRLWDPENEREGASALRAVLADDAYAIYAVAPVDDPTGPSGEVRVREVAARTPAARARVWAFLLDQDLTRRTVWNGAPVDEPLWFMLANPRGVSMKPRTVLWARLVDLPRAFAARTYARDLDVVFELDDVFCPWNAGRWRLAGGTCERTTAPAHLALDAATLAATYLGGVTVSALAAAGRVRELRPGAARRASDALRSDVAPWAPDGF